MKMNFVNFDFMMLNELNLAQEARSKKLFQKKKWKESWYMSSDEWFKYNIITKPLEQEAPAQEVVPEGWY